MLVAVVVIGFAIVACMLNVLRLLLVEQIKQQAIMIGLLEQLDGVSGDGLAERVQAEIDIAAGKYG